MISSDTQEPVAWAVEWIGDSSIDGIDVRRVFYDRESAESHVERATQPHGVIPLYRRPQPTLTDEERKAVVAVTQNYKELCDEYGPSDDDEKTLAALLGLLERTK